MAGFPFQLDDGCPDCGARRFRAGPRGGMSRNVECTQCGIRFNLIEAPGAPAQRIPGGTEWPKSGWFYEPPARHDA